MNSRKRTATVLALYLTSALFGFVGTRVGASPAAVGRAMAPLTQEEAERAYAHALADPAVEGFRSKNLSEGIRLNTRSQELERVDRAKDYEQLFGGVPAYRRDAALEMLEDRIGTPVHTTFIAPFQAVRAIPPIDGARLAVVLFFFETDQPKPYMPFVASFVDLSADRVLMTLQMNIAPSDRDNAVIEEIHPNGAMRVHRLVDGVSTTELVLPDGVDGLCDDLDWCIDSRICSALVGAFCSLLCDLVAIACGLAGGVWAIPCWLICQGAFCVVGATELCLCISCSDETPCPPIPPCPLCPIRSTLTPYPTATYPPGYTPQPTATTPGGSGPGPGNPPPGGGGSCCTGCVAAPCNPEVCAFMCALLGGLDPKWCTPPPGCPPPPPPPDPPLVAPAGERGASRDSMLLHRAG